MAAAELRRIALANPEGVLLGSEDELLEALGCSRLTIRQAARLLEREGVLRVRRGPNGGYFATRPDAQMVEAIVCSYLDTLGVIPEHSGSFATGLWIEVMREAAGADPAAGRALSQHLTSRIEALGDDASVEAITGLEQEIRSAIFELIDGGYIEVLFGINAAFARLHLGRSGDELRPADAAAFLRSWKKAKLLELEAIAAGDQELAVLAALNARNVWQVVDAKPRWTSPPGVRA